MSFGIDLGTTYSLLAQASGGRARVVPLPSGRLSLPSVVRVRADAIVVGDPAVRAQAVDPDNTMAFFKTDMSRAGVAYELGGREFTPAQLSAEVLKRLLADARATGLEVSSAVITVPAYFTDRARRATIKAAQLAGLEVVELIQEPTAAALAYGVGRERAETVLVYDLGGGTFDVSLVRLGPDEIRVLGTAGNHALGGRQFDDALVRLASTRFAERHGIDPQDEPADEAILRADVEGVKRTLSELATAECRVVAAGVTDTVEITRTDFEAACAGLLDTTAALFDDVLADCSLSAPDLDAVLLVGGSTRMPMCAELVRSRLGHEPRTGMNPNEVVALGAALRAEALASHSRAGRALPGARPLRDVTAHALGAVVISKDGTRYVNDVMIPRNAPIPAAETKRRSVRTRRTGPNELQVHMLQGDRRRPLDNDALGRFTFSGIPHDSGETLVDITFAYDEDGIVRVTASAGGMALDDSGHDRDDLDLTWTAEDRGAPGPAGAALPIDVVLVVDVSFSMQGRRLKAAKAACRDFIEVLGGDEHRVGLVSFNNNAHVEAELGASPHRLARAVGRLHVGGGTSLHAGLHEAGKLMSDRPTGRRAHRLMSRARTETPRAAILAVVALTDGGTDEGRAVEAARELHADGVEIAAVGLPGANTRLLDAISTIDVGDLMSSPERLGESFRAIARELQTQSRNGIVRPA